MGHLEETIDRIYYEVDNTINLTFLKLNIEKIVKNWNKSSFGIFIEYNLCFIEVGHIKIIVNDYDTIRRIEYTNLKSIRRAKLKEIFYYEIRNYLL